MFATACSTRAACLVTGCLPKPTTPCSSLHNSIIHHLRRNPLHHLVHHHGSAEASMFRAGYGAIRRSAFEAIGGLGDMGFPRSSIDIEIGYRLRQAGHRNLSRIHLGEDPNLGRCRMREGSTLSESAPSLHQYLLISSFQDFKPPSRQYVRIGRGSEGRFSNSSSATRNCANSIALLGP
jgi:hypothetical protein